MTKETALEMLADLLSATIRRNFDDVDDPEKIISLVLRKMKDKELAKEVKQDVQQSISENFTEDDDDNPRVFSASSLGYYSANKASPIWDYNSTWGRYPQGLTVKSWWTDLDQLAPDEFLEDYENYEEIPDDDSEDCEISYKEIANWLKTLTVNELVDILFQDEMNELARDEELYDFDNLSPEFSLPELTDNELIQARDIADECIVEGLVSGKALQEVMDVQARIRKAAQMRAKAKQIAAKRKITMKRKATQKVIEKRARRMARNMLKNRFSGGKKYSELSYQDKIRVEKILKQKPKLISALTRKMIPVVKKLDRERFQVKAKE